ncbi:unnamed protein product [Parascedosporium putredinis]|uniref:Carboxymuconolactone decarboxylase-like domain-containing protein n=1 Tax=Parascedosporium putredinis TaxID=1442378 RepID=A0A9P1H4K3_9PEZI|nr:unnamed protein product [Parascedosporium putredinis]CAI7996835.1 unnamed protein product [Parascedosporium putredinis]
MNSQDRVRATTSQPDLAAIQDAQRVLVEEGMKIREQVLGASYVRNAQSLPEFEQPLQDMAVAAGWALCWSRPGLERKTRSLICIAVLSALGRDEELKVHIRGALSNGCTEDEIREVLFQLSVYAGAPCAINATRIASRVLGKRE